MPTFCGCGKAEGADDGPYQPGSGVYEQHKDPYENMHGETATFGMNNLWTGEARMGKVPGVIRTRVGYMGGTEVVEVQFDKKHTSYDKLLEAFWKGHDRCKQFDRKNLSAVFYHNSEQKNEAEMSLVKEEPKWPDPILTEILPVEEFQVAPEAQQKYFLQRQKDVRDMLHLDTADKLMTSHVACIINSYMGGYGNLEEFDAACKKMKLPNSIVTAIRCKVEDLKVAD